MLEEGVVSMDKKLSRQSSVPPKNGATSDTKKNDNNSPNRFAKHGKKRESAGARGGTPDYVRRPAPQKSRITGDKRPRSRGYFNDCQREEVAEREDPEYGSPLFTGGSKKANLNHLLNFTFAGRETQAGSIGPYRGGRRPHMFRRVYNKERFLQANCQFVVGDGEDYTIHSIEADTLVDWDLVEQVRTVSHESPTCPICLQEPQAGKITRCGHIYCWACILHYIELGEKKWIKCPICHEYIDKPDLKSVQIREVHAYKPGERITMRLMKREKGSTYSVPMSQWEKRDGKPHHIDDKVNTKFSKLLVASASRIQETIIEPEKIALQKHMETAEDSEVCFIESALVLLQEREQNLRTRNAVEKVAQKERTLQTSPPPSVKSKSTSEEKLPTKRYTSAVLDKEESDNENKDHTEHSVKDDVAQPLPKSPIPNPESPPPSSTSHTTVLAQSDSDAAADDDNNDATSKVIYAQDDIGDLPSRTVSESPQADEEETVAAEKPRERSSLSESSEGSPDGSCQIAEMQQSMNGALPVEEAAEHLELPTESFQGTGRKLNQPKNAFSYYQASDGQHIYLHSLNTRCLVRQYGSLEDCPDSITATIVDRESIFMTDELRKRLRYLNHLPLTCEFQVAELVLKPPLLSKETLRVFADDIDKRRRLRQRKIREDKKRSKKIEEEENAKMGKFPELKINLSSSAQFPSHTGEDSTLSLHLSPDVRSDSPSLSSIASTPPISPSGLLLESSEMGAIGGPGREDHSDGEQTSMSFAQMLKAGKTKAQPLWPRPVESTPRVVKVARSADSDDSDNEDRVPVPMFQDSFSSAIQAALDTVDKAKESRPSTGGKKKKQKQKFTKLFATSMTRGK